MKVLSVSFLMIGIAIMLMVAFAENGNVTAPAVAVRDTQLIVFVAGDEDEDVNNHVLRKNIQDLRYQQEASKGLWQLVTSNRKEQQRTVEQKCPKGLERFKALMMHQQEHLAQELWKYCVLQVNEGSARLYIDASSPLLLPVTDLMELVAGRKTNLAVLSEDYIPKSIHGSILLVQPNKRVVAAHMLSVLIETPFEELALDPLLLPRTAYEIIAGGSPLVLGHTGDWYMLEQVCHFDVLRRSESTDSFTPSGTYRLNHACPQATGFCCAVRNGLETTILLTHHPILPYQTVSQKIPRPYNAEAGHFKEEELPYITTIEERVFTKPDNFPPTPNFFDILLENDCLPDGAACSKCLREKNGATCQSCAKACPCYCKALCREETEKKFLAKELTVVPPLYSRDPDRLIPRIIHQTYFEELSKAKYPNMSRLVESFKRSGWEYRFYSDEDAQNFLSTHFPSEVRQAYDDLRPGAFKADLFRYCALLIHGGVYADVDIMLESSLDHSIPNNVGFVVPVDEPGIEAKRPCCVSMPVRPNMLKLLNFTNWFS